jgi:hypothetical protein
MRPAAAALLVLLLVLGLALTDSACAQVTRTSVKDGFWESADTWNPPGAPGLGDVVVIHAAHEIAVQFPAVARTIRNFGIICHPRGELTSDHRALICLVVTATDSLVNNGQIYGYAAAGLGHAGELVPRDVALDAATLVNRGLILAGDAAGHPTQGGPSAIPGGWVMLAGGDAMFNTGDIRGGGGLGDSFMMPGGTVSALFAFGSGFPFVSNSGSIEGGAGGAQPGGVLIDCEQDYLSEGGQLLGGAGVSSGWLVWASGRHVSSFGAGARAGSSQSVLFVGPAGGSAALRVRLSDLDEDAVLAAPGGQLPLNLSGGVIGAWAEVVDLEENPAGTVVLHALPGSMTDGEIHVVTDQLLLDPGVELSDITDPPTDPPPLLLAGGRAFSYQRALAVHPWALRSATGGVDRPPQATGSPGDTARVWVEVCGNQPLAGNIVVTATDSLGWSMPTHQRTIALSGVPEGLAWFDVAIPSGAGYGMRNRLMVNAQLQGYPGVNNTLRVPVRIIPSINVLAPHPCDFFLPGSNPFTGTVCYTVRNEGRSGQQFTFQARDTEGWELHPQFTSCWLPSRADTTLSVTVVAPGGTEPGSPDTLYLKGMQQSVPMNADETYVVVHTGTQTSVGGGDLLPGPRLLASAPNPFTAGTTVAFALGVPERVDLAIYDLSGRLVRRLLSDSPRAAAAHSAAWDGLDERGFRVASGVYLVRLSTPSGTVAGKVVLLK